MDKLPYSEKNEAKKFLQNKIAKMKYNRARSYYYNEDYYEAINLFKEYIDDKYMTSDIKLDCRLGLIDSLLKYGQENYENESYWNAKENFEEVLNIFNNYSQVRNKYVNPPIKFTKNKLGEALV